jgi:hypothetical protein
LPGSSGLPDGYKFVEYCMDKNLKLFDLPCVRDQVGVILIIKV